jgi:phosphopantothenoylcysteine decarboxylase/phosphopantothenate--cysteine ligase
MSNLDVDAFFSVAAVADWGIKNFQSQKIKKTNSGNPELEFELNPDILAQVAAHAEKNKRPYCIGFAAETEELEKYAAEKRARKNVPLLVGNIGPTTFGQNENELLLIEATGSSRLPKADKLTLARQLIEYISTKI